MKKRIFNVHGFFLYIIGIMIGISGGIGLAEYFSFTKPFLLGIAHILLYLAGILIITAIAFGNKIQKFVDSHK